MAIQIIDGFQVNTALPIDNRIVASGSAARNAITYKYHGLRVFDISDNIPYVWNGSSWLSENASGGAPVVGNPPVVSIPGTGVTTLNALPNYIPKFTTNTNVIGNSIIYQSATTNRIGIGTNTPDAVPGETTTLHVAGGIKANKFEGNGSLITDINGSNIIGGTLNTNSLTNGSTGQIIVAGVTTPSWTNQSQLSVGTASSSVYSFITNTPTNATHYLTFVSSGVWTSLTAATSSIRATSTDLSYNPSTKTLNATRINYNGGTLLTPAGSKLTYIQLTSTTGLNSSNLEFNNVRNSTGTGDWTSSGYRIQSKVDGFFLGYIQFNGGNAAGVSIGTGYMSTAYSNANERLRISDSGLVTINSGLVTINGSMSHVSPNFTTNFTGAPITVGNGYTTLQSGIPQREIRVNITSVDYDRVIYVASSSNSNNYYCTSAGYFEIEIKIVQGANQPRQIFTYFFNALQGSQPSGFGYSYILPAGLSSTISLLKWNLTWVTNLTNPNPAPTPPNPVNQGGSSNGPIIGVHSVKFGL